MPINLLKSPFMNTVIKTAKTLLQQADTKRAIPAGTYTCGSRTARVPTPLRTRRARGSLSRGPTCQKRLFKFWEPRPFISIHSHFQPIHFYPLPLAFPSRL
jgi:hypothetical protein